MNTQLVGAEVRFGISSFNQIRNWVLCLSPYLFIPEGPRDIFSRCSRTIAKEACSSQEDAHQCSSLAPSAVWPSSGRIFWGMMATMIKSLRKSKTFGFRYGERLQPLLREPVAQNSGMIIWVERHQAVPSVVFLILVGSSIFLLHPKPAVLSTWPGWTNCLSSLPECTCTWCSHSPMICGV